VTGLSFDLTGEQEQRRRMVRDFAERECPKDVARRLEAAEDFPEDLGRRIVKGGLNGIGIPEEYGGQGGDLLGAMTQVVAAPDGHYGEVAAAFVELRPGASLTESEISAHCLERMATFEVPRYVRFVTEWPMSGTRIQKGRLRQRIADELAAASVTEAPRMSRPAAQAESA